MPHPILTHWSTSAYGLPPAPTAVELAQLADHLRLCRHQREHLVGLRCAAGQWAGHLGARLVSAAVVLVLLASLLQLF